ncbi:MAG: hypothetical protein NZQ09_15850 [Chloroflexus sp.]|nr:hypothetical protein [Chloroflexus sp.]
MVTEQQPFKGHIPPETAHIHPKPAQRWFARVLFGMISVAICMQIYLGALLWAQSEIDEWLLGEWLINYRGGFVRRGLIGEILWQIAHWLALDIIKLTIIVQIAILIAYLALVYLLVHQVAISPATALLFFSPAFILFLPSTWPLLGVRKEIFLGILLCLQLLFLRTSKPPSILMASLIGVGALLCVLSHEMLVVFLPYVLIATVCHEQRLGQLSIATALALIPAIVVAGLIMRAPHVDPATINAICASLQPNLPRDCIEQGSLHGAIAFLGATTQQGIQFTRFFTTAETTNVYLITGLLSAIPIIVTTTTYRLWQHVARNTVILAGSLWGLSLIATIPLFIVAADYGRFINIHVTCTTLILASLIQAHQATYPSLPQPKNVMAWIGAILFIASWRLPMWLFFATYERAFPWLTFISVNN